METQQIVSIVHSATEEVFSMMLGLPLTPGDAYELDNQDQCFDGVVALVGLAGDWLGSSRISCSAQFACRISGALLASEYASVNEEVLDAMAEVSNMIIGNVKTHLEAHLGPMGLSIPTVIYGRKYHARSSRVGKWTVVPMMSEGERLEVQLCLIPRVSASTHGFAADSMFEAV